MRIALRWLLLAMLIAAAVMIPASAGGVTEPPQQAEIQPPAAPPVDTECPQGRWGANGYRRYASRVYRRHTISKKAIVQMRYIISCPVTKQDGRQMLKLRARYKAERKMRLAIEAVTPFRGPDGRRWAIPWLVVWCESNGNWGSHNANSAARGPYQLLGHGEPWPIYTDAKGRKRTQAAIARVKLRHHQIARALYLGYGLGPWTASGGCW